MIRKLSILTFAALLVACTGNKDTAVQGDKQLIGMPNPASKYCVDIGGKLEIVKGDDGASGVCHLPNGQTIEEWKLYRQDHMSTAHTAQNALDWAGIYEGMLPCADCEGIQTKLTLNIDGTFKLEETYKKGNMKFMPQAATGTFVWQDGFLIKLNVDNETRIFFVGEGFVKAYDQEGNPIDSQLNYRLNQVQAFDGTEQTVTRVIEVGPKLVDCQGVGPMQCFLVRENESQDWLFHFQPIEEFDYQPGFIYRLKVEVIKNENPPADRSSITWKLISILSKKPV